MIYCFTRALDKTTNSGAEPYFKYIKGGSAYYESNKLPSGGLPGLQALNDLTLVITLEKPFSPFLFYPAVGFGFIYPHEAVEHYGRDFVFHPVQPEHSNLPDINKRSIAILSATSDIGSVTLRGINFRTSILSCSRSFSIIKWRSSNFKRKDSIMSIASRASSLRIW